MGVILLDKTVNTDHHQLSYELIADLVSDHGASAPCSINLNNLNLHLYEMVNYTLVIDIEIPLYAEDTVRDVWNKIHYFVQAQMADGGLDIVDYECGKARYLVNPHAAMPARRQHFLLVGDDVDTPIPAWVEDLHQLKPESNGENRVELRLRVNADEDTLHLITLNYMLDFVNNPATVDPRPAAKIWDHMARHISTHFDTDTLFATAHSQLLNGIDIHSIELIDM